MAQLESRLGLSPWDVLHQGIARHSPLSFGEANIAVGIVVLVVAAVLGAKLGLGTLANAVLVGTFIDLLLRIDLVTDLGDSGLAARIALLVGAIGIIGVASAFYIGAALGAGPRDSLMLALSERTGVRIGAVRAAIEVSAFAGGVGLGGKWGVGTLAFALLVGPSVELAFYLLERSPLAAGARPIATSMDGMGPTEPLETLLREAFPDARELSVVDRTGGGDHFQVVVASSRFDGLPLLDQHRLVNEALAAPLGDGTIHELRIRTKGTQ